MVVVIKRSVELHNYLKNNNYKFDYGNQFTLSLEHNPFKYVLIDTDKNLILNRSSQLKFLSKDVKFYNCYTFSEYLNELRKNKINKLL